MKSTSISVTLLSFLAATAGSQTQLFDFENATVHSPLPISLTEGGVTAQFSATGQGFSVQPANTMGFTPVGFSGNCIYPSSVFAADLVVAFSSHVTSFSILYAPQELACDSSATMRATAYLDLQLVGTSITNAQPGTWPSETLQLSPSQQFNRVVVHYDKPPVTGGDWGPIFMADNMTVVPAPPPFILNAPIILSSGAFQFGFTHTVNSSFTVYSTTNFAAPFSNWTTLTGVTEGPPAYFTFTDSQATNLTRRFYRVSSP